MLTNPDFKELLNLFKKYKVRFLVVGGYAVMKYTAPRFTKDLDLWVAVDRENAESTFSALKEFGAPLAGLTVDDFAKPGYFYQMGRAPLRVDIMMSIPGVEFEQAWPKRIDYVMGELSLPFISREDLILSKKAAGRPQDQLDIDHLENDGPLKK